MPDGSNEQPAPEAKFSQLEPVFDFRQHLNGPMTCNGMIFGPTGSVVSQFVADMHGEWDGTEGELREYYRYANGETEERIWQISLLKAGGYSMHAKDLIGVGSGQMRQSAACSRYRIRLGPKGGNLAVSAEDWMYLSEGGVILNRNKLKKFGVKVAELFATIRPV